MLAGVICGDRYHPADVVMQGLNAIDTGGIPWEFVLDTVSWPREQIQRYGVVVLSKGNAKSPTDYEAWLTPEVQQDFVDFVERGGGLLLIHSGTVGYKNEPILRNLVGGGFASHPAPCPVQVDFTDTDALPGLHPQSFTVHDEHYIMEMYHDDMKVFATSTSPHSTQPAGWTREQGKGRVCVLTPGHFAEVWLQPDYQHTIERAFRWCAFGNEAP